jgi:bis(5'-nucleosyl)-tetraphosphatase (symmetrical)
VIDNPDSNGSAQDRREICLIGDIHGCYEELLELMEVIRFDPERIRLIFVGDIGDRGPKSAECVQYVRSLCERGLAECALGNHENKHIRFRSHEIKKKLTGKNNPMRPMSKNDMEFHMKMSDEDIAWMQTLPLKIHIKDNWWAIHGGLEPAYDFAYQSPDQIIRCRYVSDGNCVSSSGKVIAKGKAVPLNKDKSQPANTVYWTDMWDGPQSIVYGHCVHSLVNPLVDARPNDVKCIGIDTGCVFGGCLTAFFLIDRHFVKVKAKKEYYHIEAQFDE